jgi:hypothetical protein
VATRKPAERFNETYSKVGERVVHLASCPDAGEPWRFSVETSDEYILALVQGTPWLELHECVGPPL